MLTMIRYPNTITAVSIDKYCYECYKFNDNNLMVHMCKFHLNVNGKTTIKVAKFTVSILCTEKSVIDLFHLTFPTNILSTKEHLRDP